MSSVKESLATGFARLKRAVGPKVFQISEFMVVLASAIFCLRVRRVRPQRIQAIESIAFGAQVQEPARQPAGAAADHGFVQDVIGCSWASSRQVDDRVDEGAASLREVNPVERLCFFEALFLHSFNDKLVLGQLRFRRFRFPIPLRCQGDGRESNCKEKR